MKQVLCPVCFFVLAAGLFLLDVLLPAHIALGGLPYVVLAFYSFIIQARRRVWHLAVVATILAVMGGTWGLIIGEESNITSEIELRLASIALIWGVSAMARRALQPVSFQVDQVWNELLEEREEKDRLRKELQGVQADAARAARSEQALSNVIADLKVSEERTRNLLESAPDAIVIVNHKGIIELVNVQTERLFGYDREELMGLPVEHLIPARFTKMHEGHRGSYFTSPRPRSMGQGQELYGLRQNGEEFPVEISLSPLETPDGLLVTAAIRDITDRKETEKRLKVSEDQLRESEQLYRHLYEFAPEMHVSIAPNDGTIIKCNDTMSKRLGYSKAELIGRKFSTLYESEAQPLAEEHLELFRSTGKLENVEFTVVSRDGSKVQVMMNATAVRNDNGSIAYSRSSLQDISELKAYQQKLEDYNRKLEQKNTDLEQFAYVASHDLREPLRTVMSYIDLLGQTYGEVLDEEGHKFLGFINGASDRMDVLIRGLLEYSRIGRNRDIDHVDFQLILKDVQEDLHAAIQAKGAVIAVGPMPKIMGYPVELKQLFQNLIGNAMKFVEEGQQPRIDISAIHKGDFWEFRVADNGIGIDPQHRDRIFQMFQRLNNRKNYEGTGIGLAHVRKIVELHDGTIHVESRQNGGSIFVFTVFDQAFKAALPTAE